MSTTFVSIAPDGSLAEADGVPAISGDGRYIVFAVFADLANLYVRDRILRTTELVSVDLDGGESDSTVVADASISADGRFVAFTSDATDLVPEKPPGEHQYDVYVRDRQHRLTTKVSAAWGGALANGSSRADAISPDGRFVAFTSAATNLVPNGTSRRREHVYVRDLATGAVELVSVSVDGREANDESHYAALSKGGRFVAFYSFATDLVPQDSGDPRLVSRNQVYVRDRRFATTELVSRSSDGIKANGGLGDTRPAISWDGRFIAFTSFADNLVRDDTNGAFDVFVRDRVAGVTQRIKADGPGDGHVAISGNGRFVAFDSFARNLVPGLDADSGLFCPPHTYGPAGCLDPDVFVHDRTARRTVRISVADDGSELNGRAMSISSDGRFVAFSTRIPSALMRRYPNGIFLRDRLCERGCARPTLLRRRVE